MSSALQIVQRFFPRVATVTDSRRPAVIEVTAGDASSSSRKDHNACAMAVACKRKFNLDGVIISRSTAYLVKGKRARRFKLPDTVSREVVSFDRGAGFAPGTYHLSAVPAASRLGCRTGSNDDQRTGNGHPKAFKHMTAGIRTVLGGQEADD